jgi:transposase-like protein
MPAKTKPPKRKPMTITQIAREIGVARDALYQWKNKEGLELTEANLPALRERASRKKNDGDITDEMRVEKLLKIKAERETKEHQLLLAKGQAVEARLVANAAAYAAAANKAAWEEIEDSLPPLLEGLTAAQMKVKLRGYARKKCLEMAEIFDRKP